MSKSQCSRYIIQLVELEYLITINKGNLRRICYKVDYWDDYQKLRLNIKEKLLLQIEKLRPNTTGNWDNMGQSWDN